MFLRYHTPKCFTTYDKGKKSETTFSLFSLPFILFPIYTRTSLFSHPSEAGFLLLPGLIMACRMHSSSGMLVFFDLSRFDLLRTDLYL